MQRVWMPPVWQALSSIFCGVSDRTCVRPLNVAFHDATGRYAVRKAGFTSVQRAASARAPGLNFPALNFEVRIAYSSSITHPGLAAMSCLLPFRLQVTPFDNSPALSKAPRSSAPFCSPRQRRRPSSACVPPVRPASGLYCRLCDPPSGLRSWRQRSAIDGCRFAPFC